MQLNHAINISKKKTKKQQIKLKATQEKKKKLLHYKTLKSPHSLRFFFCLINSTQTKGHVKNCILHTMPGLNISAPFLINISIAVD